LVYLNFTITGTVIGALQWWFVLRSLVPDSRSWIWLSAIGWAVGWGLLYFTGPIAAMLYYVLPAIVFGLVEWWFFLKKHHPRSFSWVIVNTAGLAIATSLGWSVGAFFEAPLRLMVDAAATGLLFGAVTGFDLVRLLLPARDGRPVDKRLIWGWLIVSSLIFCGTFDSLTRGRATPFDAGTGFFLLIVNTVIFFVIHLRSKQPPSA
jgi:hypothetical protein